ncbi:hypothetical protein JTB14_028715 [Gonioctena quinquepunctata]|nr:hypothetical protein JTB14_028715 [Gonioctena quinquepunctata]
MPQKDRRRYMNKTIRAEQILRTQDELSDLEEDIKRASRKWTEQTLDDLEQNNRGNRKDYFKLKEVNHQATYKHWKGELTDQHKNEILRLNNRMRIVGTDEMIREEPVPPSQAKGSKKSKPIRVANPSDKLLMNRPGTSIETSNMFGVLAIEGESSAIETEAEVERKSSQA